MKIPDVTAYRLDHAMARLKKAGVNFYIKQTAPCAVIKKERNPLECTPTVYRVLKQVRFENNLVELIVAAEASY